MKTKFSPVFLTPNSRRINSSVLHGPPMFIEEVSGSVYWLYWFYFMPATCQCIDSHLMSGSHSQMNSQGLAYKNFLKQNKWMDCQGTAGSHFLVQWAGLLTEEMSGISFRLSPGLLWFLLLSSLLSHSTWRLAHNQHPLQVSFSITFHLFPWINLRSFKSRFYTQGFFCLSSKSDILVYWWSKHTLQNKWVFVCLRQKA